MKKRTWIMILAVTILANGVVQWHMDRNIFPKPTMAQQMGTERYTVPGSTGYSPSSNWWEVRAFQAGLGRFFGRIAGWWAGGGAYTVPGSTVREE